MSDKFISPEQPPEGLQRELLTILMEECAEVQQRASKMLRFGVTEVQPGQNQTNSDRLSIEVGDLQHVISRCVDEGLMSANIISQQKLEKRKKLNRFLQSETV